MTFAVGQLPPVNAFWPIMMYAGRTQLLIENPINQNSINSPRLPQLKKNPDGSITFSIQECLPGKGKGFNLLAANGLLVEFHVRNRRLI